MSWSSTLPKVLVHFPLHEMLQAFWEKVPKYRWWYKHITFSPLLLKIPDDWYFSDGIKTCHDISRHISKRCTDLSSRRIGEEGHATWSSVKQRRNGGAAASDKQEQHMTCMLLTYHVQIRRIMPYHEMRMSRVLGSPNWHYERMGPCTSMTPSLKLQYPSHNVVCCNRL